MLFRMYAVSYVCCFVCMLFRMYAVSYVCCFVCMLFRMYAVYLQQWIFVCMHTEAIEQRKIAEELFST